MTRWKRSELPNMPGYGSDADASEQRAKAAENLLRLALVYVECYHGRFPDNVDPEHLKRFRRWRDRNST
jgi:hypothetical protein